MTAFMPNGTARHTPRQLSALLLGLLVLGASSLAVAQPDPSGVSLQVEHFEPLPNQNDNLWNVMGADTLRHLNWTTGSIFHYSKGLFVAETQSGEKIRLVDSVFKAEVFAALGLLDVAEIGLILPVALSQSGDDLAILNRAGDKVDGVGLGDLRFVIKGRLLDPADFHGVGLAFAIPVSVPTGDEVSYNSESDVRFEPKLSLDYRHEFGLLAAANIGFYMRDERAMLNLVASSELRWSAGVAAPTGVEGLQVLGTIFGALGMGDDKNPDNLAQSAKQSVNSPIEFLAGARYNTPWGLHSSLGGGMGLNSAVGAPEYRLLLSLGFSRLVGDTDEDGIYDDTDQCVEAAEDPDGFDDLDGCPDLDNDADGIADAQDSCPNDTEDPDDFNDSDGCPDIDNDEDGITDDLDACTNEAEDLDHFQDEDGCPDDNDNDGVGDSLDQCADLPEDQDGFEDEDGCPDPDNDGDNVLDEYDLCDGAIEDMDGFEDNDGCPDLDNDHDGLLDGEDQCPDQAEIINGIDDEDGCPDQGESRVNITKEKIEILEKIEFKSNKAAIETKSLAVLNQVASVLKTHPDIKKIRIEGHTDSVGKAARNKTLSQQRAEAVRDYLVAKGIDESRLDAVGFGQEKPLDPANPKDGSNRRVEFNIVE
ncbi:MAG: hypothetical protein AUK47_28645 [Deltaproteobacteria bacterium CG2_30_63_29]|nr:MAG: hypothetical protein AUK47_28645 [Deltaproteobacteria bacterium CG2_30_63_29]